MSKTHIAYTGLDGAVWIAAISQQAQTFNIDEVAHFIARTYFINDDGGTDFHQHTGLALTLDELPQDQFFRQSWAIENGAVVVDFGKAISYAKSMGVETVGIENLDKLKAAILAKK